MKKEKWTAKDMIDALKETKGMVYLAARKLGCSPQTVYTYAKRYPTVQDAINEERGHFIDTCELALNRAVLAGEGWAVCFALKTLGKSRGYIEKHQFEHGGPEGGAIPVAISNLIDKVYGGNTDPGGD